MFPGRIACRRNFRDPLFNPHHLELFYYVAKYGGISAASRAIPYGISQPAISGQMSGLERHLGTRLFERKPFRLTEPGRKLYARVSTLFDGLDHLEQQLRGRPLQPVRLASDDVIGPEFLPAVIAAAAVRPPHPGFELRTGPAASVMQWLQERQVQLVITTADCRPRGVRSLVLARPGLRLLVARKAKIDSPGHFWRQGRITEPLIGPAEAGAVWQAFERGLRGLRVEWPASIRTDSPAAMLQLVAGGHGVGVGLDLPSSASHPEVRALSLPGFDSVPVVALWRPSAKIPLDPLLAAIRATARKLW